MSTHSIKMIQQIPVSTDKVWEFFADPKNLQTITPPDLSFKLISKNSDQLYPGQIIEYRLRPLWNIPFYWMTEITHVQDKKFFVDEQRFGPYAFWHHQHHFKTIDGGTEMTDIVHYRISFGAIGDIADRVLVRERLAKIFSYRRRKAVELFGDWSGPGS